MSEKNKKVRLLVLNDYLKFERKIYQLFGFSLGRPIKLKTVLYFVFLIVIESIIYFTPIIGKLINWMPAVYLILIPAGLAYLLAGIRTEGRTSIAFFRSFLLYFYRKGKDVTYRRGREIAKPTSYKFIGYSTVSFDEDRKQLKLKFHPKRIKFKKRGRIKVTKYLDQPSFNDGGRERGMK